MKWKSGLLASATFASLASCATSQHVRSDAIDHLLSMCVALAEPGIEAKADGEVWFWFQVARAKASRQLWNPAGIRAIEEKLAGSSGDEVATACLQRALREAQHREIDTTD